MKPRRGHSVVCICIGLFVVVLAASVFAGQAHGTHGDCRDASWYVISAIFLPAAIFISVPFTMIALHTGIVAAGRGRLLMPVVGIILALGSTAALGCDGWATRQWLRADDASAEGRA
jgi:hypothetical protein